MSFLWLQPRLVSCTVLAVRARPGWLYVHAVCVVGGQVALAALLVRALERLAAEDSAKI
jgi:hypothetical protein